MSHNQKNIITIEFVLGLLLLGAVMGTSASAELGASLYIAPPHENPAVDRNFTLAIKVDSLAQPINAVSGFLRYDKDKIEIINISKIGSIFNLWVEEPNFSNIDGTLKFQGGVPAPGFTGNGGTVLLVIFKAKVAGITTLLWDKGEVLASDGRGTNILSDLQNVSFVVERNRFLQEEQPSQEGGLNTNQILAIVFLSIFAVYLFAKLLVEHHNFEIHQVPPTLPPNLPPSSPAAPSSPQSLAVNIALPPQSSPAQSEPSFIPSPAPLQPSPTPPTTPPFRDEASQNIPDGYSEDTTPTEIK